MGKPALCVQRDSVDIDFKTFGTHPLEPRFFQLATKLVDRDLCETDDTLLQLIPYIGLRDEAGRLFCYERGVEGGEPGLHGELSIGLGGHVDLAPHADGDLEQLLIVEGERELLEEAGIAGHLESFDSLIFTGALGNPAGRFHIGLYTEYQMSSSNALQLEPGIIEKGRFMNLAELLGSDVFDRLEPWSQAVVNTLRDRASTQLGGVMMEFAGLLYAMAISSPTGATSSTTQEVGAILNAVGANLYAGHADARIFDHEEAAAQLQSMRASLANVSTLLGAA